MNIYDEMNKSHSFHYEPGDHFYIPELQKNSSKDRRVTIRLDENIMKALNQAAEDNHVSVSELLRFCIHHTIEKYEDENEDSDENEDTEETESELSDDDHLMTIEQLQNGIAKVLETVDVSKIRKALFRNNLDGAMEKEECIAAAAKAMATEEILDYLNRNIRFMNKTDVGLANGTHFQTDNIARDDKKYFEETGEHFYPVLISKKCLPVSEAKKERTFVGYGFSFHRIVTYVDEDGVFFNVREVSCLAGGVIIILRELAPEEKEMSLYDLSMFFPEAYREIFDNPEECRGEVFELPEEDES